MIPLSPTLDPLDRGVRLLLTAVTGADLLDVTIPAGAYDRVTKSGWKVNGAHTAWRFKAPGPATQGIEMVTVKLQPKVTGAIKFGVKGKNGDYAVTSTDLPVTAMIVFDVPAANGGQCVKVEFPATPPASPACRLLAGGATLKCK